MIRIRDGNAQEPQVNLGKAHGGNSDHSHDARGEGPTRIAWTVMVTELVNVVPLGTVNSFRLRHRHACLGRSKARVNVLTTGVFDNGVQSIAGRRHIPYAVVLRSAAVADLVRALSLRHSVRFIAHQSFACY